MVLLHSFIFNHSYEVLLEAIKQQSRLLYVSRLPRDERREDLPEIVLADLSADHFTQCFELLVAEHTLPSHVEFVEDVRDCRVEEQG